MIAYKCANGHVRSESDETDAADAKPELCRECNARLVSKIVPLFECAECGNIWGYSGDAESPTCSDCRSKRTAPVRSEDERETVDSIRASDYRPSVHTIDDTVRHQLGDDLATTDPGPWKQTTGPDELVWIIEQRGHHRDGGAPGYLIRTITPLTGGVGEFIISAARLEEMIENDDLKPADIDTKAPQ
ncbi:hypothetical protein RYH80_18565 [Halobaculum sp. MBLA0147]|uniref:hypothetical protein n=1 Tax=Halobaculum sp. MBLA0147 TaxID=3079934 RepID=UPI003525560A